VQRADRAVLADPNPGAHRRGAKAIGQLGGVDERGAGANPQSAPEHRRVDQRPHAGTIEHLGVVSVPAKRLGLVLELGELVVLQSDGEIAGELELGVDPQSLHIGDQRFEVARAQPFELLQLLRAQVGVQDLGQRRVRPAWLEGV